MAYVGSGTISALGVTHKAISYTPTANGNALTLVVYSPFNSLTITWPSGFTQIATDSNVANNGPAAYLYVAENPNASTGVTSYDPSWGATTTDPVVMIFEHSGRSASITSNVSQGNGRQGSSVSPVNCPLVGLTALASDDIIWLGALSGDTNSGTWTISQPAGYTSRLTGTAQTSGEYGVLNGSTKDAVSAGATGTLTGTFTNSGLFADTFGIVIALPAAAAASAQLQTWQSKGAMGAILSQ